MDKDFGFGQFDDSDPIVVAQLSCLSSLSCVKY
jgi:hypothetical protein